MKSFRKQFQAWLQQRKAHWLCESTSSMHPESKLEVRCFHRSRPDGSNGDLHGHKETGANPTHRSAQHYWVNSFRSLHCALHAIICNPIAVSSEAKFLPGYHSKEACGRAGPSSKRRWESRRQLQSIFCDWTSSENLIYVDLCIENEVNT